MSGVGPEGDISGRPDWSALPPTADITGQEGKVRFGPEPDLRCRLSRSTASAGSPTMWAHLAQPSGMALSVLADCLFRTHAHGLVWSIQYWPSVRYCGMNCPI